MGRVKRTKRWGRVVCGLVVCAMAVGMTAGCLGTDRDERPDGGWSFRDGGADTTPDGGEDPPDKAQPVAFHIVNESSRPIYIEPIKNCQTTPPGWISLKRGGEELRLSDGCPSCTCQELQSGEECGGPCAGECPVGQPEAIVPSERKTWQWGGTYLGDGQVGGESCLKRTIPPKGREMSVEVCWGSGELDPDRLPGEPLNEPKCKTVRFAYGETDSVEVAVEGEQTNEPKPTRFVLKNGSNRQIRVRPASRCQQRPKDWLRLRDVAQDGSARVDITNWCGECSCESVEEGGGCAVCDAICTQPKDRVLNAGESISLEWNGHRYRQDRVEGAACVRETVPESGKTFVADICWWELDVTPDGMEPTQTCESVEFAYGRDGAVTHTVEPKEQDGPVQTEFILKNESGKEVRIQKGAGCGVGWLGFPGSSIPAADGACSVCTCETVEMQGGCPLCGACRPPYIGALGDGESVRTGWNGYTYKKDTVDGRTCDRKQVPRRGESFQVEYCWSTKSGPTGSGELGDQTCTVETFQYGDAPVVHTIR